MKSLCSSLLATSLLLLSAVANDEPHPPADSVAAQEAKVLWTCPDANFALPVEASPSFREFQLPPLASSGSTLALRFRARFQWPVVAGVSRHLVIRINKQSLNAKVSPLLNRENDSPDGRPAESVWWKKYQGYDCLVLHFSPQPEVLEPLLNGYEQEQQWYLIRIDDLISFNNDNAISFENRAVETDWSASRLRDPSGIIIDALTLVELPRP